MTQSIIGDGKPQVKDERHYVLKWKADGISWWTTTGGWKCENWTYCKRIVPYGIYNRLKVLLTCISRSLEFEQVHHCTIAVRPSLCSKYFRQTQGIVTPQWNYWSWYVNYLKPILKYSQLMSKCLIIIITVSSLLYADCWGLFSIGKAVKQR